MFIEGHNFTSQLQQCKQLLCSGLLMCCVQNGLTALSIAQRLGYISVVEILRHITDVTVTPAATEDKYKVIAPETMQEAPMSDSEEEVGKCGTPCVSNAVSVCSVRENIEDS